MIDLASNTLPVLLVDDEAQVLRSMKMLLRTSGIDPILLLEKSQKPLFSTWSFMKIAAPSQLATPFHGLQNTSRFNQTGGWGEVGRPNGSLGVGVELIIRLFVF